jgi:protein O-mannosyl-transferase
MSRSRLIALLLALGTLLLYLPVCHYPFINFDDSDYVTENAVVQSGLTWHGLAWAFTTWHAANWHPLTWLSHMLDCQLFGLNAGMPHAENALFHTANTVLLFLLLLRLLRVLNPDGTEVGVLWPGALVAALFAWHPMHVESVAWVAERKDVLSTFFALLTLLAYTRFVEAAKVKGPDSKIFYGLALLCFALGLMSKPMVVTLPCVMLLLDFWPLGRFSPSAFRLSLLLEKIPFFLLVAASCVVTFLAQHHGGAVISLHTVPLTYRLENTPLAYEDYLEKLFWPVRLAVFYPLLEKIAPMAVVVACVVLIAISAAVWLARKRVPYGLVGWLWFMGTLVPVIGLVQVGSAAFADRYSYFPSIGIFLAVTLAVRDVTTRFRFPKIMSAAAAGLVLACCLFLTHCQLQYWHSDIALFSHAIAVTKNNETAHINLGYALEKMGEDPEAMAEYRAALKINPGRAETHNNLANLLDDAGDRDKAEAEYREALRINPKFVPALNNLGTLLVEEGRFDEAMKLYARSDWHAPYLTGKALLKLGRDLEAVPFFQQAVRLDPNNPHVLAFLAEVLASDENPNARNGNAAFLMAEKANALTGGYQPAVLDVLAMAYAELGRFNDAQQAAQDALDLARRVGDTNDVPLIRKRLDLYQGNQPFRQSFTNAPARELPKE